MKRIVLIGLSMTMMLLAAPARGDAGSGSGSGSDAGSAAPTEALRPTVPPGPPDAAGLRKTCADAMNADPTFAADIVKQADKQAAVKRDADTVAQHQAAADDVALNQRHVILAYAAMWILAAVFVMVLWSRHQKLKTEIATLREDLRRATEDAK